jgi:hypothetical protein
MRVFVEYRVPVLVEVDDEDGSVVSVRVDDECVEGPFGVVSDFELSDDDELRVIAVAEGDMWPAWAFGI